jgi:archaellum component FlaC
MIRILFTSIWWFGFVVAVGLMLGLYIGITFIENHVGVLFLAVGIQHMILLVILGFFAIINERDDNIEVGNRVATMGYLHTLIGTSVALIMTSKFGGAEMIEHIDTIIAPIGSALITSIIGWAFGKEMERERYRYKLESTEQSDNALEFLAQKVKKSAMMIEQSSQRWVESMEYSTTQLVVSSQKLEETIHTANHTAQKSIEGLSKSFAQLYEQVEQDLQHSSQETQRVLATSKEEFQKQFEQIERQINSVERNFDATSKDANRVFKKSIETFDTGLGQMSLIAKEWDRHIKSMKKFSTHSESALENLTEHSQKVIDEFASVAKSIPSAGKVISDIDDFLSKLKRER